MPKKLGIPVYYDFKKLEKGVRLVTHGEYVGETKSTMGTNYNFIEIDGEQRHVVLSGGSLKWRIQQGHFKEGNVVDIDFGGVSAIGKGKWAGKPVNNFEVAIYSPEEVEALLQNGAQKIVAMPKVEPLVEQKQTDVKEALDDLE